MAVRIVETSAAGETESLGAELAERLRAGDLVLVRGELGAGKTTLVRGAAIALGVAASTIHRLLNDGIIAGEQITPGAPWRIRLTDETKARFNADAGDGFLPMREAIRALGVSRQTVLQRVKRGELEVRHVTKGRQKGLRIKVITRQTDLFNQPA